MLDLSRRQLETIILVQWRLLTIYHSVACRAVQQAIDEYEDRIEQVIEDTNKFIIQTEEKVNEIVAERDDNWKANLEELWTENEKLREKLKTTRMKRKDQRRWENQDLT